MVTIETELRRSLAVKQWQDRLQNTDCMFTRLVFLSTLRNDAGRYTDSFLLSVCPATQCHNLIARAHQQVFREWLSLSARDKARDLRRYLVSTLNRTPEIGDWNALCRAVLPSSIGMDELNLFLQSVRQLATLIASFASDD